MTRIAAALILGCSSPRAPVPESPAPTVAVPVASVPDTPQPPAEPAPRLPAEVREPAEVACRIPGVGWRSEQLRLRAGGARFARADRAPANVVLPVTADPREAVAIMDDKRVLVRAVIALDDVRLYAPKPTAFLGIVTPAAETSLHWTSSTPGSVRVLLGTKGVLRAPDPFVVGVACNELAIVTSSYNARESITKAKTLAKRDVIKDGAPLAAAPNATPVAELDGDIQVELVETRGGQARILVERPDLVVSGWVSQKDLGPAQLRGLYGHGGTGGDRGYGMGRLYLMHCPSDVSLFVELGSERVKVGLIHKDAGFRVKPENEADKRAVREIDLPESHWLLMEENARLQVDAVDLKACRQDSPGF